MKKYFTTGLAILLPLILTALIVLFLINLLTKPFLGITENVVNHLIDLPYVSYGYPGVIVFLSKVLILCGMILFVLLIGILGKLFLIDYLFKLGDKVFHNVPLINKIYKACQDVVHSLFSSSSKSFSQVVFVPFPLANTLSVGLITKESISINSRPDYTNLVPVFVPGTPNPSVGFLLMFRRDQLVFVNMRVEEAMKFVVSCGVVMSDFSTIPSPTPSLENENVNEA